MDASEEKMPLADQANSIARPIESSSIPVLGEGFQESNSNLASQSAGSSDFEDDEEMPEEDSKAGKRRLFGFGRKKDEKSKGKKKTDLEQSVKSSNAADPTSQPRSAKPYTTPAPLQSTHPYQSYSPSNRNLHSSSPRVVSPAGSQIFERDVQESTLPGPNSPAIPAHIQTENHIPAVLDASSEAITDENIDPNTVEIVMHASHQPAAVTVTGVTSSEAAGLWADDLIAHPDKEDAASNYGALDSTDVRRLSFISFADVVQSEHAEHSGMRDSIHVTGLTSLSSGHRSPSPMRSPVSSPGLGTSPPTSKSASVKGLDLSPGRNAKPLGSPNAGFASASTGGELTIETMSQALKKMGSSDLGGHRSQPMSPVSLEGPAGLSKE